MRPVVVLARLAVVAVARADFFAEVAVPLAPALAALAVDVAPDLAVRAVSCTPSVAVGGGRTDSVCPLARRSTSRSVRPSGGPSR